MSRATLRWQLSRVASIAAFGLLACACSDAGEAEETATPDAATEAPTDDAPEAGCVSGEDCVDDDPCTVDDTCNGDSVCVGVPRDCDDGIPCTDDVCESGLCQSTLTSNHCLQGEGGGCVPHDATDPANPCRICYAFGGERLWLLIPDDKPCEDTDACTTSSQCQGGICAGLGVLLCLADGPCDDVTCQPATGCVHAPRPTESACEDGDACTEGETCDAAQDCVGGAPVACDDGDACTSDTCHAVGGCVFEGGVCDDADACTQDSCQAGGECVNTPFEGPCDDGDPCTVGEVCTAATGCAGGEPTSCDDGLDCTSDACDPTVGCVNLHLQGACDDGLICTSGDECVAGACVGLKDGCEACPVPVTGQAQKLTAFFLGTDGNAATGVDVDNDLTTCQPAGKCSHGVDNAMAVLAPVINPGIGDSLELGTLTYVAVFDEATFDGEPFPLTIHFVSLADGSGGCDIQKDPCKWQATQLLFDGDCAPSFAFQNATITDGVLSAGGPGTLITIMMPLTKDLTLPVTIAWASMEATLTFSADAGGIATVQGWLGGALVKSQLLAALAGADPSALPFDQDALVALVDNLMKADIDLDGDGTPDAASLNFAVQMIPATLVPPPL